MKKITLVLVCALVSTVSSQASSIAWVSFHSADGTPDSGAAGVGFTQASDVGYTSLLTANGHTVTRFVTKNDPTPADATFLNGFDMVIIGRSVDSAHYQQENETLFWNSTITKPLIAMSGYVLRNVRLGYTAGGTISDTTGTIGLSVLNPSHPIFAGIPLDGANLMVNPFARITLHPTNSVVQRGISVNTDALVGGGTALARVGTAGDPAVNGMIIGEWAAGSTIHGSNVLGGHRLVFLSGSREHAAAPTSTQIAGMYDLVGDGPQLFLNAVAYMAVVPSLFVQFAANPNLGVVPLNVQFTCPATDSTGKTITNWNWTFGDGSSSTAQNPSHAYTTPGTYQPRLWVTNNSGQGVAGLGPPVTAAAYLELVSNGGFESGNFSGWTLNGQSGLYNLVDTFNQSTEGMQPHAPSSYFARLGQVGSLGYLSQTLTTMPGAKYLLSFWLNSPDGLTPNQFLVSWNGSQIYSTNNLPRFGTNPAIAWRNLQFSVTATASTTVLQFGFRDDPTALGLDDISVVQITPVVTLQPFGDQLRVIWSGGTLQSAGDVSGP